MVLIVWDKLFGTFQAEIDEEPVKYGITKMPEQPYHPLHGITHEFENILADVRRPMPLKHRLGYIFRPPGWSHDGTTKTSRELQQQLKDSKPWS